MAITPQVGKSFEAANGNRATVNYKLDKPDVNGVLFVGVVRLNGSDQMAGWNTGGVCPANHDFNLESLWPIDDSRQYTVIKKFDGDIYRSVCIYYAELGSLKHDNPGERWALKIERSNQGAPTAEIIDLDNL